VSDDRKDVGPSGYDGSKRRSSASQSTSASRDWPKTASQTVFPASAAPKDLPPGAIGLPEVIFEDLIEESTILAAVSSALDGEVGG
jgi:hypothetical protein